MRLPSPSARTVLVVAALAVTPLGGCGDDDTGIEPAADEAVGASEVRIEMFSFEPSTLRVAAGTSVRWTNGDDATHSIRLEDGEVASDDLGEGDTFEHTFEDAGEYAYLCGIHQYMRGSVVVD